MTISMDAAEVMTAVEVAAWVVSLVAMLIGAWVVYLIVRPSRRRQRGPELDSAGGQEMLRLMDRMERRLQVLERVVAEDEGREERMVETGDAPHARRTK